MALLFIKYYIHIVFLKYWQVNIGVHIQKCALKKLLGEGLLINSRCMSMLKKYYFLINFFEKILGWTDAWSGARIEIYGRRIWKC